MSWDVIPTIFEVVGVIAVVASLVYVAVQIRQSTAIARTTIIHETSTDAQRIPELIAQDPELATIYDKGVTGQSLSGVDLVRYVALLEMYLMWLENIDSQAEAGLFFKIRNWRMWSISCYLRSCRISRLLRLVSRGMTTQSRHIDQGS